MAWPRDDKWAAPAPGPRHTVSAPSLSPCTEATHFSERRADLRLRRALGCKQVTKSLVVLTATNQILNISPPRDADWGR